jgi:predicted small secreted protein
MRWTRLWLPALLVAAAPLLASCGNTGSSGQGDSPGHS